MKVVLLHDVPKLGKKYDIKDVSDGHALNLLVPKGLVELATASNLKKIEGLKALDAAEKKIQMDLLLKNLGDIKDAVVTMKEKANEKGHLFAGVHKAELIPAIKAQTHLDLAPEFIVLEKPIKTVGEHMIEVKVGDKSAEFKLVIEAAE
jgi:large subunit ribosomal protein L9